MHVDEYEKNKYGIVFNIQSYSVHDGPGIRTLVFLKGCPLRCRWCCNPESHILQPELAYNKNKCIGIQECIMCIEVCSNWAIKKEESGNKIILERELCNNCFLCVDICPSKALFVYGKRMNIDEVLEIVGKDSIFYARSGGGMTISGGEPFMQADFTIELLKEAKQRRINTAIETSGFTDWSNIEKAVPYLDTIFFDIKCMDKEKHKEYTGVSNDIILENFKKLCSKFANKKIIARTPVIPGFNDSEEDIKAIIDFIKDTGCSNIEYELLPYHRLGIPKYEYLGKEYPYGDVKLDEQKGKILKTLAKTLI
ncbi:4-hydroxyphenylacetate decarboxylase activating enzyme [Moorella humiferrea]|uniref:(2S)-3-sulfopropanediol dehydratase activating enzyme n=1 Tax=Neomoorella humiferrea TaxID=676965 RepID=UPI0030D12E89